MCTSSLLHEFDKLSLHGQWLRLPEDGLYQDVLFDSATCDVGFVKGLRLESSTVGLDLGSSTDLLRLIEFSFGLPQLAHALCCAPAH
jgi:hypothetical protein